MKRLIKYIILFVFVCVGNVTWAEEGERESSLFPDSSYVLRGPKADFLEKYRKDAALIIRRILKIRLVYGTG